MDDASLQTRQLEDCLQRLREGDRAARDELLRHVQDRLRRLARKMLKSFPAVRRWAETDDVLQNALIRLLRALDEVSIGSLREFFALSTEQIRRELLDLARHYYGPCGMGARHVTDAGNGSDAGPVYDRADLSHEPAALAAWCEFHEQVQELPAQEREVISLLYYQGVTQAEAAAVLGVTVRTVQRRWQAALLKLHQVFQGCLPGE